MKKHIVQIAALVLAALLVVGVTGCVQGNPASIAASDPAPTVEETAQRKSYLAYSKAQESNQAMTSFSATSDIVIKANTMGQELEIPAQIVVKARMSENGTTPEEMEVVMTSNGQEISSIVLFDGMIYTSMLGVKTKTPYAVDTDIVDNYIKKPPVWDESIFETAEITEADGGKIITMTVPAETMTELFGDLSDIIDQAGVSLSELDDMDFVIKIGADGSLKEISTAYKISIESAGTTSETEMSMRMAYEELAPSYQFSAPEDADEYTDADAVEPSDDHEITWPW